MGYGIQLQVFQQKNYRKTDHNFDSMMNASRQSEDLRVDVEDLESEPDEVSLPTINQMLATSTRSATSIGSDVLIESVRTSVRNAIERMSSNFVSGTRAGSIGHGTEENVVPGGDYVDSDSEEQTPSFDMTRSGYFCQICFTDYSESNSSDEISPFTLSACKHKFCEGCIVGFVASKINCNDVAKISCFYQDELCYGPGSGAKNEDKIVTTETKNSNTSSSREKDDGMGGCGKEILSSDIMEICSLSVNEDKTLFERYERYKFDREHPEARRCPECQEANFNDSVDPSTTIASQPMMTCSKCAHVFCYNHSNAHPNSTCEEYEKEVR